MSDMRAWMDPSDGHVSPDPWGSYTRRALVINPENDEHVRALVLAFYEVANPTAHQMDLGRTALRSLLNPPKIKPAEPDQHGARVIDEGVQYVAAYRDADSSWLWTDENPGVRAMRWSDFSDDVEVLS